MPIGIMYVVWNLAPVLGRSDYPQDSKRVSRYLLCLNALFCSRRNMNKGAEGKAKHSFLK